MDPEMEARWAAWVARGHQHDLAVRRKFRIATLSAAVLLALIAAAFRLFGGAF
jgi:hypothetical protein